MCLEKNYCLLCELRDNEVLCKRCIKLQRKIIIMARMDTQIVDPLFKKLWSEGKPGGKI